MGSSSGLQVGSRNYGTEAQSSKVEWKVWNRKVRDHIGVVRFYTSGHSGVSDWSCVHERLI